MALIKLNYRSSTLHRATNVSVILPTGFRSHEKGAMTVGNKYQVLWLLHGGMDDDLAFLNASRILQYAEKNKIAVIMPSCEERFYHEPFYSFVTEELRTMLQFLFPLSDRREDNFIGGLSHGGDCAMKAALEHPDRYAGALVMSAAGSTHFHDPNEENYMLFDAYGLAEKLVASGEAIPQFIFATGSGDRGHTAYLPVFQRLEEIGLPFMLHFVEGDGHSWQFWDDTLNRALSEWLPLKRGVVLREELEGADA